MNRVPAIILITLFGLVVLFSAGCAQVAHKVDILYSPLSKYRGGTGSLELVNSDVKGGNGNDSSIRWALGQIKNSEGVVTGDIISTIRPQDVIVDAFNQELSAAGYKVSSPNKPGNFTEKGIDFTNISIQLDEVPSFTRLESSCAILLKMDLWKSGAIVKRLEYGSKLSDIAVVNRELLSSNLFQKAIQEIMHQALPDIIKNLH